MGFGDIIQSKTATINDGVSTDLSAVFDSQPTEGNLLLALHFTASSNSIAPSGFAEAVALTDGGNFDQGAIYYKEAGAAESSTVTASSSSAKSQCLTILEVEGPWLSSPLDVTATSGPGTGATRSSGTTAATAQNDEFAAVLMTSRSASNSWSSWTNSFTERSDIASDENNTATATKLLSSAAAQETTATPTQTASTHMGGIAVFKKDASGFIVGVGQLITLGIGTPSSIPGFLTLGLGSSAAAAAGDRIKKRLLRIGTRQGAQIGT